MDEQSVAIKTKDGKEVHFKVTSITPDCDPKLEKVRQALSEITEISLWATKHIANDLKILNHAIATLEIAEGAGDFPEYLKSKRLTRPSITFCPVMDLLRNLRRNMEGHMELIAKKEPADASQPQS
jgi:hypothetical protein